MRRSVTQNEKGIRKMSSVSHLLHHQKVLGVSLMESLGESTRLVPGTLDFLLNLISSRSKEIEIDSFLSPQPKPTLKKMFKQFEKGDFSVAMNNDLSVVSAALRFYLEKLPEPLFPISSYKHLIHLVDEYQDKPLPCVNAFKFSLRGLPSVNVECAHRLLLLLNEISPSLVKTEERVVVAYSKYFLRDSSIYLNVSHKDDAMIHATLDFMIRYVNEIFSESNSIVKETKKQHEEINMYGLITPRRTTLDSNSEIQDLKTNDGVYKKKGREVERRKLKLTRVDETLIEERINKIKQSMTANDINEARTHTELLSNFEMRKKENEPKDLSRSTTALPDLTEKLGDQIQRDLSPSRRKVTKSTTESTEKVQKHSKSYQARSKESLIEEIFNLQNKLQLEIEAHKKTKRSLKLLREQMQNSTSTEKEEKGRGPLLATHSLPRPQSPRVLSPRSPRLTARRKVVHETDTSEEEPNDKPILQRESSKTNVTPHSLSSRLSFWKISLLSNGDNNPKWGDLKLLRRWAEEGSWLNFRPEAHIYEWWMFPIKKKSRFREYVLTDSDVSLLKQNEEYMILYREGIKLINMSWGWDVVSGCNLQNPTQQQQWYNWETGLAKMALSLQCFGEELYFQNLKKYYQEIKDLWKSPHWDINSIFQIEQDKTIILV